MSFDTQQALPVPARPFQNAMKPVLVVLATLAMSAGLAYGLYHYLVRHVAATDIAAQTAVFTLFAIVLAVLWGAVGYRNPGEDDRPWQRHFWSAADLAWVVLALFSLGKTLLPVENHLLKSAAEQAQAMDRHQRAILLRAVWTAQDGACQAPTATQAQCVALARVEREFTLPAPAPQLALEVHRQLSASCAAAPCDAARSVIAAAERVTRTFLEHEKAARELARQDIHLRRPEPQDPESTIQWAYGNVIALIVVFGLRCGRTVAEARRNHLVARRKKEAGKPAPAAAAAPVAQEAEANTP